MRWQCIEIEVKVLEVNRHTMWHTVPRCPCVCGSTVSAGVRCLAVGRRIGDQRTLWTIGSNRLSRICFFLLTWRCAFCCVAVKDLSSGSRSGIISRDNPLHVDHINRFWDRFSAAMRDKDLAIQAELSRQVFHPVCTYWGNNGMCRNSWWWVPSCCCPRNCAKFVEFCVCPENLKDYWYKTMKCPGILQWEGAVYKCRKLEKAAFAFGHFYGQCILLWWKNF